MNKKRLGIDVWVNGKKLARCAAPKDGTFTAVVGDVPKTYAGHFVWQVMMKTHGIGSSQI